MTPPSNSRRRTAALFGSLLIAALSVVLCLVVIEVAFRWVPALLPAGTYGSGERHPELGINVHGYPVVYNKARYVRRTPNSEGFLDVEHERGKPANVFRIGFFGDSYVESMQVPLETVFYRQLGEDLGPRFETLGFGMSGWGTFHSLQAFRLFSTAYRLDMAIYAFVENDLGDQIYELAAHHGAGSAYPFAEMDDGVPEGFRTRWVLEPGTESWQWHLGKFLQRHSFLAHTVRERLAIISKYGLSVRAEDAAREMSERARKVPRPTDLPASWPAQWADHAQKLGSRVLAVWAREARERGIPLAILYVPRSESQLTGAIPLTDTWKPWLLETAAKLGIPIIDPSDALRAAVESGETVYDDHWSPAGHEVIARVLASYLRPVGNGADAPSQGPRPGR